MKWTQAVLREEIFYAEGMRQCGEPEMGGKWAQLPGDPTGSCVHGIQSIVEDSASDKFVGMNRIQLSIYRRTALSVCAD